MKICLAQIQSYKGEIDKNITKHIKYIKQAIDLDCDLIVFPELSITNYEPTIAKDFATNSDDKIFIPFQNLANEGNITICIGLPTVSEKGILISMLIFQPNTAKKVYSKNILHEDELPFFTNADCHPIIECNNKKIGLGICYETLQKSHIHKVANLNAEIFIASVSKPERGINKGFIHFPTIAKEFKLPILMINSIGKSDDFIANGQSAIWNKKGKQLAQLNANNEGLLVFNTTNEHTIKKHLTT